MKYAKLILAAYLMLPVLLKAQGSSCGSPHNIILDGVNRTYATSTSTGGSVVCTNYAGNSPVTWFSFTTNAAAEMPLMDISAKDGAQCEIAMYTACNGGGTLQALSSMCFDDGEGLWAPAHNYTLTANTTYRLRIKTATATEIKIEAQSHTPTNNFCSGATPLDANFVSDNNACNLPSSEVTPSQICAYTIENTAFYQFYVASTGSAIININSIACDNGATMNTSGFQIGFFTGSCGALTKLSCTAGEGTPVQATTPSLPAGTKVYVAIDGESGSNCKYGIQALNAYAVLAENFKNFSVWKKASSNIIKWTSLNDRISFFEIERSQNGKDFTLIGKVSPSSLSSDKVDYSFEDSKPLPVSYYRVKQVYQQGRIALSETIKLYRDDLSNEKISITHPVSRNLDIRLQTDFTGRLEYSVISLSGIVFLKGSLYSNKGTNQFYRDVSALPAGKYLISFYNNEVRLNQSFIKLN